MTDCVILLLHHVRPAYILEMTDDVLDAGGHTLRSALFFSDYKEMFPNCSKGQRSEDV